MDKSQEKPKKCFCARCFCPIEPHDQVNIDGQNFHKMCSTCCICRKIPTSIKMFYGHVFCADCFKNHVLIKFRNENQCVSSNNWWMQWAPQMQPQPQDKDNKCTPTPGFVPSASCKPGEAQKRCICARCLQPCHESCKVDIGGQSFHPQCARCYVCHCVPTNNVKIYYGHLFCEECFNRHVLGKGKNHPAEFFKTCFDQWQNNPQFAANMTQFMASSDNKPTPVVLMGAHPASFRCSNDAQPPQDWTQPNETHKSAATEVEAADEARPSNDHVGSDSGLSWQLPGLSWPLSCDSHTTTPPSPLPPFDQLPDAYESANNDSLFEAEEKIEKLTKYLQEDLAKKQQKKWQNFIDANVNSKTNASKFAQINYSKKNQTMEIPDSRWTNLQDSKVKQCCPKCLWQCGQIHVSRCTQKSHVL